MHTVEVSQAIDQEFLRYFRCPEEYAGFEQVGGLADGKPGYFRYDGLLCYGRAAGATAALPTESVADLSAAGGHSGSVPLLPFDPQEVAANLRMERYVDRSRPPLLKRVVRQLYYMLRPALPVHVRRHLQRRWLQGWATQPFPQWPVDTTVDRLFRRLMEQKLAASGEVQIPFVWFWPEGKQSCAIMTHDVETAAGLAFTEQLMDINDEYAIKSSFQLIPDARYTVTPAHVEGIRGRGFEVNVHDLKHDGHLFDDERSFTAAAARINAFGKSFGSRGFRSGALYRNQEWYGALDFAYDMSVPNCAHLDPQRGGCSTVTPYFVGDMLELPVTATQDYSLFHVLGSYATDLWQQQIGIIMEQNGMISFIVHPDYLNTTQARECYRSLLTLLADLRRTSELWVALPGEVNDWWRQRNYMRLEQSGAGWRVTGEGADRARVAYASLGSEGLTLSL